MNAPQITKITATKNENDNIKTSMFEYSKETKPGQFFMIWIPGIDEIPMSVSYIDENVKAITFKRVGEATSVLFDLEVGDKIGVRGPYGKGFNINRKKILFVGGGTGVAMLAPALEEAVKNSISSTVIIGVKNKSELFFETRLKKSGAKLLISTDDGSVGYKGFASDVAKKILKKEKIDNVLTCGPEVMMKIILDCCENISFQASLERYIKCSIGICGQCCLGKGLRVCIDGPVFDGKTLKKVEDFGVYRRDSAGRKIQF